MISVLVNGSIITRFTTPLITGLALSIRSKPLSGPLAPSKITLYCMIVPTALATADDGVIPGATQIKVSPFSGL